MAQGVLELNRKEKIWICSECKKEYRNIPAQCVCGALAPVFDERDEIVGRDEERKVYTVLTNIIYNGKQINKGEVVSLVVRDRVTKTMLERKLIVPLKEDKKE